MGQNYRCMKRACDENIRSYTSKIVWIGLKAHHSVNSVAIDYLYISGSIQTILLYRHCNLLLIFVCDDSVEHSNLLPDNQKHGATRKDRDSIRSAILNEAVIVCSTLSFGVSALLSKLNHGFDVFIIDEAGQAFIIVLHCRVEPATLVPLATGCKQVFLLRSFPYGEFNDEALEVGSDVEDYTTRNWRKYAAQTQLTHFS